MIDFLSCLSLKDQSYLYTWPFIHFVSDDFRERSLFMAGVGGGGLGVGKIDSQKKGAPPPQLSRMHGEKIAPPMTL